MVTTAPASGAAFQTAPMTSEPHFASFGSSCDAVWTESGIIAASISAPVAHARCSAGPVQLIDSQALLLSVESARHELGQTLPRPRNDAVPSAATLPPF